MHEEISQLTLVGGGPRRGAIEGAGYLTRVFLRDRVRAGSPRSLVIDRYFARRQYVSTQGLPRRKLLSVSRDLPFPSVASSYAAFDGVT